MDLLCITGAELCKHLLVQWASQVALVVKNIPVNAGDVKRCGFDPWTGNILGEGNGNLLHYSCPESPMNQGVWQAIVMGSQRGVYGVSPWGHTLHWVTQLTTAHTQQAQC